MHVPQLTQPVRILLEEAENLWPDNPIMFETMTDPLLLQRSAGAAVISNSSGKETIYIDPNRIDEYKIAHEILHIILHRSGQPQMYYMLPDLGFEPIERRIADELDNIFDHYRFNSRLDHLGPDPRAYKEWFVSVFDSWPTDKMQGPSVIINAFKLLDGLLFGDPYRAQIVTAIRRRQPEALALAERIEERLVRMKAYNISSVRSTMLNVLDLLNRWIAKRTGRDPGLRKLIGVMSPFSEKEMQSPASKVTNLTSQPLVLNGRQLWLVSVELKVDTGRYYTKCFTDRTTEPTEVTTIRQQWQAHDLRTFLSLRGLTIVKYT